LSASAGLVKLRRCGAQPKTSARLVMADPNMPTSVLTDLDLAAGDS
jgi:hypothetical protein